MATKGKQATKGQKQIFEENQQTVKFYTIMASVGTVVHFTACFLLFYQTTSTAAWVMFALSVCCQFGAIQLMRYASTALHNPSGQLVDAGVDLNIAGGSAEYLKDLVILSTALQALALITAYFWLIFIVCPLYVCYLLWTNFLGPWLSAPSAAADGSDDDKKRKKEKRKFMKVR